ncbi:hypothetical protein [Acaryochloris marina]|uniref:Uncharacterized protein n=1 Tax=Acaryochloris marina (strain MBIC 11017) TaxID=329726 RepID=A8ZK59_ACAM1|nr:hypothetical protein [Acaryochloris marina]ABW31559.1 hypothetical protein AM1_A0050 [Acaryochloris marina MBIC11017]
MPSATIDKLNQLKVQLEQCNNDTAALLLKRTIAKLESQLQREQLTTQSAKLTPQEPPKTSQTIFKQQSSVQDKKVVPQQQQTTKNLQAKSKQRNHRKKRRPLLPGNGTHRAWCRIPGIIRVQEAEAEAEQPVYFIEMDGHQLSLRVKKRFRKLIGASLDTPLMVKCYPQIIEGQIVFLQFCGAAESAPETPEDWVMIGVWNSENQRVLVQRDQRCDQSRRILQHSPLVKEACLEKLEGGKLYRYQCQREGFTVTIVGVEVVEGEEGEIVQKAS